VLNTLGVSTVIASLSDHDKVTELAGTSSVVINTADSDDVEAQRAILRGLKARHDETGEVAIYIHTVR